MGTIVPSPGDAGFAWAVMEYPDAVAVVSQMINVYEEPGVAFEFPAFPSVPREMPAVVLQQGAFSSSAHYGPAMIIRKVHTSGEMLFR